MGQAFYEFPEILLFPGQETMVFQETDCILFLEMPQFPDQETPESRKPPPERDILERLMSEGLHLPELRLDLKAREIRSPSRTASADAELHIEWGSNKDIFIIECKSQNTPKVLEVAIAQAVRFGYEFKMRPMVVVPYLNEGSLDFLESHGVSGMDLCGNGLILGERFVIRRDGKPNRFTSSAPIKNVFKGTSSLFARCFLLKDRFVSHSELREFAISRAGNRTQGGLRQVEESSRFAKGTASKVVHALAEELIVVREGDGLRLVDPRRLIENLRQNYASPGIHHIAVKTSLGEQGSLERLWDAHEEGTLRSVMTGLSSASYYGLLSTTEKPAFYVNDLTAALKLLEARPASAFSTLQLLETKSGVPFFDARQQGQMLIASPIQAWLEMSKAGPRERDAARELESDLANGRGAR